MASTKMLLTQEQFFQHEGDGKTGLLNVPPGTRQMFVQLWGAGGAGGGCTTQTNPLVCAVGGGGGGGAYAEAYFLEPFKSNYEYYVAVGATGGNGGTGMDAESSWFGIKNDVYQLTADGGKGGACSGPQQIGQARAFGGLGRIGGGEVAYIKASGSAGSISDSDEDSSFLLTAGSGGAAAYASGSTQELVQFFNEETSVSTHGKDGIKIGGGGGGTFIANLPSTVVQGGNGANGHLTVTFIGIS